MGQSHTVTGGGTLEAPVFSSGLILDDCLLLGFSEIPESI